MPFKQPGFWQFVPDQAFPAALAVALMLAMARSAGAQGKALVDRLLDAPIALRPRPPAPRQRRRRFA
jgi:hypothetical protein